MPHRALYDKWKENSEVKRRKRVKELISIYSNDWKEILQKEINENFKNMEEQTELCIKADTSLNLLRWSTDTLAAVYSEPVTRRVEGLEEIEIIDDQAYNMTLDAADKMMFLCREVFVRPLPQDDGRIILDVATPDRVAVVLNKENHRIMEGIAVQISEEDGFQIWTPFEHYMVDRDWNPIINPENPEGINPYGIIPWVACHATFPLHSFFNDKETLGLKRATLTAGVAKTDFNHLRHVQSFKQLAFTGTSSSEQKMVAVGPTMAIHVKDPSGRVEVLDLQANLNEHLDSILSDVAATLNLYGIRPEQVKGTLSASSGYALEIQMHETEKVWEKHRQLWRLYEQELYRVALIIQDTDGLPMMPLGSLFVEFSEVGPTANPQDELNYHVQAVNNGLMSKKEAMQRLWQYDDEKVFMEMEQMKLEQAAASPMGFSIPLIEESNVQEDPESSEGE